MTIHNLIPKQLDPYVWFGARNELVHSEDMPSELNELFAETKERIREQFSYKDREIDNLFRPSIK